MWIVPEMPVLFVALAREPLKHVILNVICVVQFVFLIILGDVKQV
jgi:hypothetical protein